MMCLLSTSSAPGVPNPTKSAESLNFSDSYQNLDSPFSSTSSDSSTNSEISEISSISESKSPPMLSPQGPIFVKLEENDQKSKFLLNSPQMALLTPQNKENIAENIENFETRQEKLPLQTVPFTFCNMKPNIFDLKKKRGRKPKNRNENTAIFAANENDDSKIPSEAFDEIDLNSYEKPCPLRKRKYSYNQSHSDDHSPKSIKRASTDDFEEDEIINDFESDSSEDLHLQIDDEEDETETEIDISENDQTDQNIQKDQNDQNDQNEQKPTESLMNSKELVEEVVHNLLNSIVNEKKKEKSQKFSVPLIDIFYKTPINSFMCYGCSKHYNDHDTFSINLKCQTMKLTCSKCLWWTQRKIGFQEL